MMKILKESTYKNIIEERDELREEYLLKSKRIEELENDLEDLTKILHSMSRRFNHEVDKIVESLKNPSGDIYNLTTEARRINELGGVLTEETLFGIGIRNREVFQDAFVELKDILNSICSHPPVTR